MLIIIPRIYSGIAESVRRNLLLSGYSGALNIELTSDNCFSVGDSNKTLFQVVDSPTCNSKVREIVYSNVSELPCHSTHANTYSKTIFVGVTSDAGRQLDCWFDEFQQVISYPLTEQSISVLRDHHLCWLIVFLFLQYPLEDAMLFASAMSTSQSDVSRETWDKVVLHSNIQTCSDFSIGTKDRVKLSGYRKLDPRDLGLYPVVDNIDLLEALLKHGIKTVQLRLKSDRHSESFIDKSISKAVALSEKFDTKLFINDHWKLAIKHGAYGIHLGQEDLHTADLDQIHSANLALGISTHSYYEILKVLELKPSYIALGHIFPTPTKVMKSDPRGLQNLAKYQAFISHRCPNIPTVAIGGINLLNAEQVLNTGVSTVAVVRAVSESSNLSDTISKFNTVLQSHDIGRGQNDY